MQIPDLHAGKVFSPDIKAVLQFIPRQPWKQLTEKEFEDLEARLEFLD
jgi:hypothetical protein